MNVEKTQEKPFVKIFLMGFCVLIWLVGFTYSTGFGQSYEVLDKAKMLILALFLYCIVIHHKKYNFSLGNVFVAFIIIYMIIINEARNEKSIETYIWVWLIIPIMKMFTVQERQFKLIGFAYGVAAFGILLIGNATSIFAGWDGNSVSMVQFFSYTVFMASLADTKDKKNVRRIVIYSIIYLYLINAFGSRSAQLFSIIMLLCMISVIPFRRFYSKSIIVLALLFPLVIAIVVVLMKDTPMVENLNDWSYEVFNKPIFNGRDALWESGLRTWTKTPFIGNGDMNYVPYHNSSIATLVGAGGIGYLILISACYKILIRAIKWISDSAVYGLATSFLVIWMQQSVELGMIAAEPNVIPYMILGLLYARINTLESENNGEVIHNSADL